MVDLTPHTTPKLLRAEPPKKSARRGSRQLRGSSNLDQTRDAPEASTPKSGIKVRRLCPLHVRCESTYCETWHMDGHRPCAARGLVASFVWQKTCPGEAQRFQAHPPKRICSPRRTCFSELLPAEVR